MPWFPFPNVKFLLEGNQNEAESLKGVIQKSSQGMSQERSMESTDWFHFILTRSKTSRNDRRATQNSRHGHGLQSGLSIFYFRTFASQCLWTPSPTVEWRNIIYIQPCGDCNHGSCVSLIRHSSSSNPSLFRSSDLLASNAFFSPQAICNSSRYIHEPWLFSMPETKGLNLFGPWGARLVSTYCLTK